MYRFARGLRTRGKFGSSWDEPAPPGFTGDLMNRGATGYTKSVPVAKPGVKFCPNRTGEIALNGRSTVLVPLRDPFTTQVSPTPSTLQHGRPIRLAASGRSTGAVAPPLSACSSRACSLRRQAARRVRGPPPLRAILHRVGGVQSTEPPGGILARWTTRADRRSTRVRWTRRVRPVGEGLRFIGGS